MRNEEYTVHTIRSFLSFSFILVYTFSWKRNRYIAREFVAIPYVPLYGH